MQAVFLDTNVLSRNFKHSQQIKALVDLVEAGLIEIFLSSLVVDEWKSQRIHDFEACVGNAAKAVKTLNYHPWSADLGDAATIQEQLEIMKKASSEIADAKCNEFLTRIGVKELPFHAQSAEKVFHSYFGGEPPFGSPKNRNDIPDAFILQALRDLDKKSVFACINDKRLGNAAKEIEGVRVFSDIKELHADLKPELEQFAALVALLREDEGGLKSEVQSRAEVEFEGLEITHPSIPEDNSSAFVNGYYEIDAVEFDWDNLTNFGGGWLSIPVRFKYELELLFHVYRLDAFSVPEWVHVTLGDFESDHYFEATGTREFEFIADLVVKFTEDEIEEVSWPDDFELNDLTVDSDDYEYGM